MTNTQYNIINLHLYNRRLYNIINLYLYNRRLYNIINLHLYNRRLCNRCLSPREGRRALLWSDHLQGKQTHNSYKTTVKIRLKDLHLERQNVTLIASWFN